MGTKARLLALAILAASVMSADARMRHMRLSLPRAPRPAPDAAGLTTPDDRAAFRSWTCALALAQARGEAVREPFPPARDCADLLDIVYREGLARHDKRWRDRVRWKGGAEEPGRDVRRGYTFPLLRRLDARPLGRRLDGLEDGDLLFFRHPWRGMPERGMLHCGGQVVYHTGPSLNGPGRVKAVPLAGLLEHPDARWRPLPTNPYFLGVYRWLILD